MRDRTGFKKTFFSLKNGENGPKIGFLGFIGKFSNFLNLVYEESSYYLLYSCTNPIRGKNLVPEIWAKMLSVNQTAGFLNRLYLQHAKIFRALVYLESWYIRNPGVFRTRGIFRTLLYSEPSNIQNLGVFCENSFHAL